MRKFVGIYSGRLGKNELEAQLGIVWKKEVIQEMLNLTKVHVKLPENASTIKAD